MQSQSSLTQGYLICKPIHLEDLNKKPVMLDMCNMYEQTIHPKYIVKLTKTVILHGKQHIIHVTF